MKSEDWRGGPNWVVISKDGGDKLFGVDKCFDTAIRTLCTDRDVGGHGVGDREAVGIISVLMAASTKLVVVSQGMLTGPWYCRDRFL